jgi:hypothetical protein
MVECRNMYKKSILWNFAPQSISVNPRLQTNERQKKIFKN